MEEVQNERTAAVGRNAWHYMRKHCLMHEELSIRPRSDGSCQSNRRKKVAWHRRSPGTKW